MEPDQPQLDIIQPDDDPTEPLSLHPASAMTAPAVAQAPPISTPAISPIITPAPSEGCLGELGWFGAAFVLPLYSLSFYHQVVRRRLFSPILVLFVFGTLLAGLTSLRVGWSLLEVRQQIFEAYATGNIPTIRIENGLASVDSEMPFVLTEGDIFLAVDPSGQFSRIPAEFGQGLLMTQSELHIRQQSGRYQIMPLSSLNEFFGHDPLVINADWAAQTWSLLTAAITGAVFISMALWNTLIRLAYLSLLGLLFWGIAALVRPGTQFGPVLVVGLYASVAQTYLSHLLNLAGVQFFGMATLLIVLVWGLAMALVFRNQAVPSRLHPIRLWRATLGLPLLLILMVTAFGAWEYKAALAWTAFILTGLLVWGISWMFDRQARTVEA